MGLAETEFSTRDREESYISKLDIRPGVGDIASYCCVVSGDCGETEFGRQTRPDLNLARVCGWCGEAGQARRLQSDEVRVWG